MREQPDALNLLSSQDCKDRGADRSTLVVTCGFTVRLTGGPPEPIHVAMPSIEQLEKLLSREPDDAFLNFGLAMQLSKEKRSEESLARFDHVIRLDPAYTAAYHQKGIALISLQRMDDARNVLTRGIEAAQRIGNGHAEAEMSELLGSIAH